MKRPINKTRCIKWAIIEKRTGNLVIIEYGIYIYICFIIILTIEGVPIPVSERLLMSVGSWRNQHPNHLHVFKYFFQ